MTEQSDGTAMTHDQSLQELAARLETVEPLQDWTAQLHPKPEKYDRYVAVLTKDQRDAIVSALRALSAKCGVKVKALEKACRDILPYLRWTISDESPGHHPTMPSAVAAFQAALGLGESSTSSDDDDRYSTFRKKVEELVFDPIQQGGRMEVEILSAVERVVAEAKEARWKPSDPTPAADREAVARIIMRYAGEEIMTDELAHLCADAILSTGAGR